MPRTRDELERIASFADALPAAIWVGSAPSGDCVYVNRAFKQVLGIEPPPGASRGNYVGPYGVHRLDGAPYPESEMPFERVMTSRGPVVIDDLVIHRHDGGRTYLRVFASPLFDDAEQIAYVVEAFTDITLEIEARQEREAYERRAQVAQRLDAVGRRAGGVAHDFNNLLATVKLIAGQLMDVERDPDKRDLIRMLDEVANSAAKLTQALLGFAPKAGPANDWVDVGRIVSGVAELARRTFGKRIVVDVALAEHPTIVRGDGAQIGQIVMNLAVNARDAIGEAGRLRLETRSQVLGRGERPGLDPGPYVVIEVSDTGGGIDEEVVDRVFEPYMTTKTRDSTKGTGLGLAITYGLAKAHGGIAEVAATGPAGTTMRVFLRAVSEAALPVREQARAVPTARTGQGTILVVDDEPLVLRVTSASLRRLGYETLEAENGDAAVAVLDRDCDRVVGVVLDVNMPGPPLAVTCAALQARKPGLPILLVTGAAAGDEVRRLAELGVRGLLQKPFDATALSQAVAEAITSQAEAKTTS